MIGGSDDISRSIYEANTPRAIENLNEVIKEAKLDLVSSKSHGLFETIIHVDSQIDVKPRFKLQIEDRDKVTGEYLFQPTYHEHHRSYLREIFAPEN